MRPSAPTRYSNTFTAIVPCEGFLFTADKWWTRSSFDRKNDAVVTSLMNAIHSAYVLVGVRSDDGRPLAEMADDLRKRESVGVREVSSIETSSFEDVDLASFGYRSSARDEYGKRLVERFVLARSPELPGLVVEFFGIWTEDHESKLAEDMHKMAATLQAIPPAMVEQYRRCR